MTVRELRSETASVNPEGTATHPLRLTSPPARAVLVFFLVTHAILLFANLSGLRSIAPSIVAFALIAVASTLLVVSAVEPFPRWATLAVALTAPTAAALISWQLPSTGPTGYASWHLGAVSLMLFTLALRGRMLAAWLAMAATCAITIVWAMDAGRGFVFGLEFTVRHPGILLIGTVFAVGLRRTARRVRTVSSEQNIRADRDAESRSVLTERAIRMMAISDLAEPTLRKLSTASTITPELAREARLLEAELRDALRAPELSREPLITAAREARARGVEIVLMDDSTGAYSSAQYARAVRDVAAAVEQLATGRLTARLLPYGRGAVATIVSDYGTGVERLTVALDDPARLRLPAATDRPRRG